MNDAIIKLLKDRYFLSNETTWEELAKRVSSIYPDIYPYIEQMKFIPSSPTLMNGGTSERLGTLSSCFPMDIEDSIEGIFDSLKEGAIVTKYGGGCVAKDSLVYIKDKGLLKIQEASEGDYIYSYNIKENKSEFRKILQTHKPIVPKEKNISITLNNETELITSLDHPTLVWRENKLTYVSAKDIKKTDLFLKFSVQDIHFKNETDDPELGWFTGCHLGDGSAYFIKRKYKRIYKNMGLDRKRLKINIVGDEYNVVKKYADCINKYTNSSINAKISTNKLYKSKVWDVTVSNFSSTEFILDKIGFVGKKTYTMYIPNWIWKSSRKTMLGFIAGLIDSDGYISKEGKLEYATASLRMKDDFILLLNFLGFNNVHTIIKKENVFSKSSIVKQTKTLYKIIINNIEFLKEIKEYMSHEKKKYRILQGKSKHFKRVVLIDELFDIICNLYICKKESKINSSDHKNFNAFVDYYSKKEIKLITKDRLDYFINNLYEIYKDDEYIKDKIKKLYEFTNTLITIKNIKFEVDEDIQFYDLTVDLNNNYFSGRKGLSVIHNTGFDFSKLRSSSENIKTLGALSSGPVTFIGSFNRMLDDIRQGGKRRGAGMGLLSIDHPDILDFINLKKDINQINRFNLSIKVPSYFYDILEKNPDKPHIVKNVTDGSLRELKNSNGNIVTVKDIWNMIIEGAWLVAEPGIFNSDIAYNQCTVTNINSTVICNPCSEFTNIPYTACSLGSINLSSLTEGRKFNWEEFEALIVKSTRFLNNTIDKNKFPIKKIKDITTKTRPIGLGIMGLAHSLYKKEIPYNSEKAFKFTEEVIRYLTLRSMKESIELAKIEGAYEAFDYDLFIKANERFFKYKSCRNIDIEKLRNDIKNYGVRNSCYTSIAPTGSIAYLSEVSGGIEPVFALSYSRKIETGMKDGVKQYDVVYIGDPVFNNYIENNFDEVTKKRILKEVSENRGSCQKCKDIPDDMKKIFVVAGDLTPMEHLDILEAAAVNTSLSVSKTINLPNDAKKEDVSNVFLEAYKRGIIGVTVYRDGCREGILIHDKNIKESDGIVYRDAPERPEKLPCEIHRVIYQGQKWIVFIGLLDNRPFEAFAGAIEDVCLPKNIIEGYIIRQKTKHYSFEYDDEVLINNIGKSFYNKEHDAFARSISMHLQFGVPLEEILIMLNKAEGDVTHFAKVIARTLKKYVEDGVDAKEVCPTCGSKLRYTEGCLKCSDAGCGYSKCG